MQNDTPAAPDAATRSLESAVPALAFVALLIALIAPRGTPGLVAVLTLPTITLAAWQGRLERPWRLAPLEWSALALGGYLVINASWSVVPGDAYGKVALFFLFGALVSLAATAIPTLSAETRRRLQHAFLVAVATGTLYLAIECLFGQPILRLTTSVLPFLRPPKKNTIVADGWVTSIALHVLNRNFALLSLVLWPALLVAGRLLSPTVARVAATALLAVSAVAIFRSEHETSMIALVGASMVFVGISLAPRVTRILVVAGWVVATLLVVPITASTYKAGLYKAQWLPKTARNRIVLWGVTASRVAKTPILGIGVNSIKPLDMEAADKAEWPKDHPFALRTGRHSHNIYMQTWYELGGVGALLVLAFGLVVLRTFSRLGGHLQPYAYASFVSAAVIGAFSWGMWQPWFMAAFSLWGVSLLIAMAAGDARTTDA